MKNILAKAKGSVLAYSLILLAIVLTASIGMMSSSVVNFRSVSMSDKSGSAFQIADSGAQAMIANIKKSDSSDEIKKLFNSPSECSDPSFNLLTGKYRVSFYDEDESPLDCNDDIGKIASIKSVGTYSDTTRAVQVAVAAGGVGTYQFVCTWDDSFLTAYYCFFLDTQTGEVKKKRNDYAAKTWASVEHLTAGTSYPIGTYQLSIGRSNGASLGLYYINILNTADGSVTVFDSSLNKISGDDLSGW